jgi:hypothetical protein
MLVDFAMIAMLEMEFWKMTKRLLNITALLALIPSLALAANAPDTPLVTGPIFQQLPAAQIYVTPTGGAQTTLGNALAASGASIPTAAILGGSGGILQPVTLGTNLSLAGSTLNATGGASPGGTTGQVQTNNGSGGLGALPIVGTGSVVLSASPTIATPTMTGTTTTAGITDSGGITTTTLGTTGRASTVGINDTSASGGASVGGGVGITTTGDLSSNQTIANWATATADHKSQALATTLGATGTATHVWENFDPSVTLTGATTGEINVMHPILAVTSSGSMVNGEALESAFNIAGTTTGSIQNYLALGINSGTMATALGYQTNLTNTGSITTLEQFHCSGVTGNAPTNDYCFRNDDASGTIMSLGHVLIGAIGTASSNQVVKIVGPDALSGTAALIVTATGGLGNILLLNDAGTLSIGQNINIGTNGTQLGYLTFESDTSGTIKFSVPSGALTTYNLVLPAAPPSANGDVLAFTTAGVGSFVANGGGGGAGCVPAGLAGQILLDSGSGTCADSTVTLSGAAFTGPSAGTAVATTITGGTSTTSASAGGTVSLVGGVGGATGAGGLVEITAGTGTGSGNGGSASVVAGVNGATGTAGTAFLTGGGGASGSTANGGTAQVSGGTGANGATGNGGGALIIGGDAASTNGNGGGATLKGGTGTGTGIGGGATVVGAVANGAGGGAGSVNVTGGAGASGVAGGGGAAAVTGGASGSGATGTGGSASLIGGASLATNGAGGQANMTGGVGIGTGAGGNVVLTPGAAGASGAVGVIKAAGLFEFTSGTPTIASGACGTGTNGTIAGTDQTSVITIGAVATTACAVSFGGGVAGTYPTAPKACLFAAGNAAAAASTVLPFISAISATGFTLSGSVLASTVFEVHCF